MIQIEQRRKNAHRRALEQAFYLWIPLISGVQIELLYFFDFPYWYSTGSLCLLALGVTAGILCVNYHRQIPMREEEIIRYQDGELLNTAPYAFETLGVTWPYMLVLSTVLFFFIGTLIYITCDNGILADKLIVDLRDMITLGCVALILTGVMLNQIFKKNFMQYELLDIPISEYDLVGESGTKRLTHTLKVAIYGSRDDVQNIALVMQQLTKLREELEDYEFLPPQSNDEERHLMEEYNKDSWTEYKNKYWRQE